MEPPIQVPARLSVPVRDRSALPNTANWHLPAPMESLRTAVIHCPSPTHRHQCRCLLPPMPGRAAAGVQCQHEASLARPAGALHSVRREGVRVAPLPF